MPKLADLPAEILRLLCQFIASEHVAYLFATHNALLCSKLLSPGIVPSISSFGARGPSIYFLRSHAYLRKLSLGDVHDEPDSGATNRFRPSAPRTASEMLFSKSLLHEVPGAHLLELRICESALEDVERVDWDAWKASSFASLFPALKLLQISSGQIMSTHRNIIISELYKALPTALETLTLKGVASWPLLDSLPSTLTQLTISKTEALQAYHGLESSIQLLKRLSDRLPVLNHLDLEFQRFADHDTSDVTDAPFRFNTIQHIDSPWQLAQPSPPPPSYSSSSETSSSKMAVDTPIVPFFEKLQHLALRAVTPVSWTSLDRLWPLLPSLKTLHVLNFAESTNDAYTYPPQLECLTLAADRHMNLKLLSSIPSTVHTLKLLKLLFNNERPPGAIRGRRRHQEPAEAPSKWVNAIPSTVTHLELRHTSEVDFTQLSPTLQYLLVKPKGFRAMSLNAPLPCPKLTVMRCRMFSVEPEMIELLPSSIERLSLRAPIAWNQHEVKRLLDHLPYCHHLKLAPFAVFVSDHSPVDAGAPSLQPLDTTSSMDVSHDALQDFSLSPALVSFFGHRFHHLQFPWGVYYNSPATGPTSPLPDLPAPTRSPGALHFGPELKSVMLSFHVPGPPIPAPSFAAMVSKAINLESLSCFSTVPGPFDWSVLTAMKTLTILQLATETSSIDFKALPRSLTDIKTRRLDLRAGSRHSGPYLVGTTRYGTTPPARGTFGSVVDAPTLSGDRFVIDLPRGITRLSIASTMIAPQKDEDWPPNLTDIRFASDGWTVTQLASLKNHLTKLTQGSVHGVVEYDGSLHHDAQVFEVSKIESLVLASLRPLFVDSIAVINSLVALLPSSITTISLSEYEQDCNPYNIVEPASTAANFAVDRMMTIYPQRQISNKYSASMEYERPFRTRINFSLSSPSLAFFENLTTLKIAMHDCNLEQLRAVPRTLTTLFIVAEIANTVDLVAALPPALVSFGFASSRLHYFTPITLKMLPSHLTVLQAEHAALMPIHAELLPIGISDLVFDSNHLWLDTDLLNLARRLNSEGQLKRLKVFNALASGAILPSSTTYLSSASMVDDNGAVLGPQCDITWSRLASPLHLEHLTKLVRLDLSQAAMPDLSSGLTHIPSGVTELHLRVSGTISTRYMVNLLPKPLLRFHLYLFNTADTLNYDTFWSGLPRCLEELSIQLVIPGHIRRRTHSYDHVVPVLIGESYPKEESSSMDRSTVPHLEGAPTSLRCLVLPSLALAHRCHEWSLPNLRFLKAMALGRLMPNQTSALVSAETVLDIESPQHVFTVVTKNWSLEEQNVQPGTFRFVSADASVPPNPSDHTTLTVSSSLMLPPPM